MPRIHRTIPGLRSPKPAPSFESPGVLKEQTIAGLKAKELKLDRGLEAQLRKAKLSNTKSTFAPKLSATAYRLDPKALQTLLKDPAKVLQFVYGAMQHAGGLTDLPLEGGFPLERDMSEHYDYENSFKFAPLPRGQVQSSFEADVLQGRKEPEVSAFRAALTPVVGALLSDPTTHVYKTSFFDTAHTTYSAVVTINEKTGVVRVLKNEVSR